MSEDASDYIRANVLLRPDTLDKIKRLAQEKGVGVSPYLRMVILDHLREDQKDDE